MVAIAFVAFNTMGLVAIAFVAFNTMVSLRFVAFNTMGDNSMNNLMKRAVLLGTLVGILSTAGTALASDPLALPGGEEGCVSAAANDTCTYTPTRGGGSAAEGTTWTLTVEIAAPAGDVRDTNLDGKLRYVFDSSNAPKQGCGLFSAGSTVTTSAGASGRIAAGNPFPSAADGPVGSSNDCPGGRIDASNLAYTPVD